MTTPRTRTSRAIATLALADAATAGAGTTVALALRDRLPDPIATTWDSDGVAGVESLTTVLWMAPGLLAVLGVLFAGPLIRAEPGRQHQLLGMGVGVLTGLGFAIYGIVLMQAGLDDAARASGPTAAIALGLAAGLAAGWVSGRTHRRSFDHLS